MDGDDIKQRGKVGADPGARVVLVGDGIHAQLPHEAVDVLVTPRCPDRVQRLRQHVGAAPGADPQGVVLPPGRIHGGDERRGGVAGRRRVEGGEAVDGVSRDDAGRELVARGVGPRGGHVGVEDVDDLGVAVEDLEDGGGVDGVVLPGGGDGGDVDEVELVGVGQEPDEAHLVVGLVGDVGHDEDARLVLVAARLAEQSRALVVLPCLHRALGGVR